MSDDLIKRSDAIAEICKARTPDIVSHQYAELFINAVRRAPSANIPQGEWIPCSERLPSEFSDDERVLATTEVDGSGVILMPAYDVKSWYRKGYITAWMPLPKPWKGVDDDLP